MWGKGMNIITVRRALVKSAYRQKTQAYLFIGSLVMNALLVMTLLVHRPAPQTIIVPTALRETFWIKGSRVSNNYLAEMTRYFSDLRLTISPDSAQFQLKTLLRYVDPAVYGRVKDALLIQLKTLQKNNLSMTFYPDSVKVNAQSLTASISGELRHMVGDKTTLSRHVSYQVHYRIHQGRLMLLAFKENKKDEAH